MLGCWAQRHPKASACERLEETQDYPSGAQAWGSCLPLSSLPELPKQGREEFPAWQSSSPMSGRLDFAGGQQHPRVSGRVGTRLNCMAREPLRYSQPYTQTCTKWLYETQGKIMFKAHFPFLKLQILVVTCFSFAPYFPCHTAWAPSISPAFPQQWLGLETALQRSQER